MRSFIAKELRMPASGTPAYFIFKNYGPGGCRYLERWQNYTNIDLELQWSLWGMFQLDKIVHLRKTLESKGSQIGQGE